MSETADDVDTATASDDADAGDTTTAGTDADAGDSADAGDDADAGDSADAGDTVGAGEPSTHREESEDRADAHLADIDDGCGCAEVWEHLSDQRGE